MRCISILCFLSVALLGSAGVQAQTNSADLDRIVDRLGAVYQVDRLNQANTIRIEEDRRMEFGEHEYGPDFHQRSAQRYHYVLDFKNRRASGENVTHISGSTWHGRNIVRDGRSRFIMYAPGVVRDQGEQDFAVEFGRVIRTLGALIARELVNSRETAKYSGEKMWLGKKHDVLTFEMANSPLLTLYVEKDTGYITYMERTVGDVKVSYTFRRHAMQDGIPVAAEHSFYGRGEQIFYSFGRKLAVDDPQDRNAFEIDPGIVPEAEQLDQSAMTVNKIAENVHQVGQDSGYSTFFVTNGGIVAYGLGAGFGDRLKAYRDQTVITLPLTHAIVADLHNEDRLGAPDAAQEGAVILVTKDAADRVKSMLAESNPNARVQPVEDQLQLGDIVTYDVATAQAAQNLITYHTPSGVIAQTGHYYNPFPTKPGYADYTAVTLRDAIVSLGLAPKRILSNESRKAETWDLFVTAVNAHKPDRCFFNRPICAGL